jgi:hypothetical protein
MSAPVTEDDLAPTKTEGYKVGEKKTVEEYSQLGINYLTGVARVAAALTFGTSDRSE